MIVIETDKVFELYVRTNRRVKWRFAEYGGMYRTLEDAINSAKDHFGNTPFEYSITNLDTNEEFNGLVNWINKK